MAKYDRQMKVINFCAFDVENVGDTGEILSVSIVSDKGKWYRKNYTSAIRILAYHAAYDYTLVAHNAEYDISILFWGPGYNCKIVYKNQQFNHGEWIYSPSKKPAHIWDSMKLAAGVGIAAIGDSMGIPKLKTPQILKGEKPDKYDWMCDRHGIWECLECYAMRDAEICYAYVSGYKSLLESYGVEAKRTLPSAAIAIWRKLDNPQPINLLRGQYDQLARRSYLGGRTECFKVGQMQNVFTADVSGMYPSVMVNTAMPDPSMMEYSAHKGIDETVLQWEGASDCTVHIPYMYLPPLPIVYEGKLYFPCGRVRGCWTHLELRNAMTYGVQVECIHESLYSTGVLYPFNTFVDVLTELRQTYKLQNDVRQLVAKGMMNRLYGRFGLKHEQSTEIMFELPPDDSFEDHIGDDITFIAGRPFITHSYSHPAFPKYSNVLWASYITSAARVQLYHHLLSQGNALVYCDTDSVYSLSPINGLSNGPGTLEDTGTYSKAIIVAPKMYYLESARGEKKLRAKGVPRDHALQYLLTGEAEYTSPMRPRQSRIRHVKAGLWVSVHKEWKHQPAKRPIIDPDAVYEKMSFSETIPPSFVLGLNGSLIDESS